MDILELQRFQYRHDLEELGNFSSKQDFLSEKFLSLPSKFGKYSTGKIDFEELLTHVSYVSIQTGNVLQSNLQEIIEKIEYTPNYEESSSPEKTYLFYLPQSWYDYAKALESMDHIENLPLKNYMEESSAKMLIDSMEASKQTSFDLEKAIKQYQSSI